MAFGLPVRHYLATHANFQALILKKTWTGTRYFAQGTVHASAVSLAESCAEAFSGWNTARAGQNAKALIG
jgi:hypothetical protein